MLSAFYQFSFPPLAEKIEIHPPPTESQPPYSSHSPPSIMSAAAIHQAFINNVIKPSASTSVEADDDDHIFMRFLAQAEQKHTQQEQLSTGLSPQARRAMSLYNDWSEPDSSWPSGTLCRNGMPYAFHERLGRWVPTSERFGFYADMREWLEMADDHKDYTATFQTWYDQPRPSRQPYLSVDEDNTYE